MRKFANLLLVLAATPLLMAADVYRWTDNNGVVNYTQQKPEGVNAILISSSGRVRGDSQAEPTQVQPIATPAADGSQLNADQQKMLDDLKVADAQRQEAFSAARADNCRRATSALEQLSVNGRVRVQDANGVQVMLGEDERQERIARAQQGVAENCTPL
ncbi:MAG: DUF4124 domain-containing protein [Pseudomonadales bacterium]